MKWLVNERVEQGRAFEWEVENGQDRGREKFDPTYVGGYGGEGLGSHAGLADGAVRAPGSGRPR